MSRRSLLLLSLLLGAASTMGALARRSAPLEGPCCCPVEAVDWVVALGDGGALRIRAPREEPLQVERLTARDQALASGWSWSGRPGRLEWSRRGPLVVGCGPNDPCDGAALDRVELFDAERGHLASLPPASAWCFAGDGVAAVLSATSRGGDLVLVTSRGETRALARLPEGHGLRLEATPQRVVVRSRRRAWSVELASGALTDHGEVGDLVGVVDEVLLALREDQVVALPLGGGPPRTLDLAGQERLLDGPRFVPPRPPGTSPRLLGRSGGRWIIAYSTETLTDARTNDEGWRTPATQQLAAVDASTGQVVWRRTLGPLELPAEPASGDALADELVVVGWTEDEAHARTVWLGAVGLTDGGLRWSTTWPWAGSSAEPCVVRRGERTYLVARGLDRTGLVARFAGGRLEGALRVDVDAQGLDDDEAWVASPCGLVRLAAPSLPPAAGLLAWSAARLRLPPAARAP